MVKQVTSISSAQSAKTPIYIGLDVHKTKWVVSIYHGPEHQQTYSMNAIAQQLLEKLDRNYTGHQVTLCYEAGFMGYWLQRKLVQQGYQCLVVHPADIPSSDFNKRRKNDKLDSKHLALMLSRHLLKSIYIPSTQQEQIRELVRLRINLNKDKRRQMNRIRAYLNRHGIQLPAELKTKLWTKRGQLWIKQQANTHWPVGQLLEAYLHKGEQEKQIKKQLAQQIHNSSYNSTFNALMSVPGIGFCTATLLIGELGEMNRFKNLDKLASYCGLVPDIRASADKVKVLGVTQRANRRLRTALIECAWITTRFDPHMARIYAQAIEQGKKPQKAIIKVARKLLARIRAVWKTQQAYCKAA